MAWTLEQSTNQEFYLDEWYIGEEVGGDVAIVRGEKNARKLWAADDMLAALEGLYSVDENGLRWHSMDREQKARVDAAIAKAKGETL